MIFPIKRSLDYSGFTSKSIDTSFYTLPNISLNFIYLYL